MVCRKFSGVISVFSFSDICAHDSMVPHITKKKMRVILTRTLLFFPVSFLADACYKHYKLCNKQSCRRDTYFYPGIETNRNICERVFMSSLFCGK